MTDWPPPGPEKISFRCHHCGQHSVSQVSTTEWWTEPVDDGEGGTFAGPEYRYRLVRCSACQDVSLLIAMKIGQQGDDEIFDNEYPVYPAAPRTLSLAVPQILRQCFEEARACYQARAYTASAIMCRRSLELLATERGVARRNLAESIKALRDRGDIDQRLYDWCDLLRITGNQAAHDVEPGVTQLDAKDMSDLAEAIIDYVYVYQERYENFKKRRGLQSNK